MRAASLVLMGLVSWSAGCSGVTAPAPVTSGEGGAPTFAVSGLVVRGPIQPVCQVSVPCDAPFSAGFTVQQGDAVVAAFRSDEQGRFSLRLPPGAYLVIPGADAPILFPVSQAKPLVVGTSDALNVRLEFDTGIR